MSKNKQEKKYKYLKSHVNTFVRCEVCYRKDKDTGNTIQEWFIEFDPTISAFESDIKEDIELFTENGIVKKEPAPRRGKQQRKGLSTRQKQIKALASVIAMEEIYLHLKSKYPKINGFRVWGLKGKYDNTDISYSSIKKILDSCEKTLGWKYQKKYSNKKFGDYKAAYWASNRKFRRHNLVVNWDNITNNPLVRYKDNNNNLVNNFPEELEDYSIMWKERLQYLNDIKSAYRWGVQNCPTYKNSCPKNSTGAIETEPHLFPHNVGQFCTPSSKADVSWLKPSLARYNASISEDGMLYTSSHIRSMVDWNQTVVEIDGYVYDCIDLDYNAQGVHILAELKDCTLPPATDIYKWVQNKLKQPLTRNDVKTTMQVLLNSQDRCSAKVSLNYQKNIMGLIKSANIDLLINELESIDELAPLLYSNDLSRVVLDIQSKIEVLTTLRLHESGVPAISKRDCWRVPAEALEDAQQLIRESWEEFWLELKEEGLSTHIPVIKIER